MSIFSQSSEQCDVEQVYAACHVSQHVLHHRFSRVSLAWETRSLYWLGLMPAVLYCWFVPFVTTIMNSRDSLKEHFSFVGINVGVHPISPSCQSYLVGIHMIHILVEIFPNLKVVPSETISSMNPPMIAIEDQHINIFPLLAPTDRI
nr:hypothetical protein Iba_chr03aCG14480 [Ipomoea batatas]